MTARKKSASVPRRSPAADDKLRAWEAEVKSRVISFEVEKVSAGIAIAHWLPPRHARRRGAFAYRLPPA